MSSFKTRAEAWAYAMTLDWARVYFCKRRQCWIVTPFEDWELTR